MRENKKRVFVRTFGCQMNIRDSEVVKGLLVGTGFRLVDSEAKADVVLFNTCSIRQHAEDRVWSEIGKIKKRGTWDVGRGTKEPILGIIGCMAQSYKEKIFKRAPQVDFVVGLAHFFARSRVIRAGIGVHFKAGGIAAGNVQSDFVACVKCTGGTAQINL